MANFSDPYETWKQMGRPGGSFAAWQGGQRPTYENVPGQVPSIPIPQQYPQPQAQTPMAYTGVPSIEQMRAQAQQAGASEDFLRFQQGDIDRWGQYYDAAASARAGRPQFRSGRGMEGFYDKPTECPPGMVPGGPNETDGCVGTPDSARGGAGFGAPAAMTAGGTSPQAMPFGLSQMMAGLPASSAQTAPAQPLTQAIQPYQAQNFQSATGGAFNKLVQGTKNAAMPGMQQIGTGWSQGSDGLTQMMAKRQKQGPTSQGWWM